AQCLTHQVWPQLLGVIQEAPAVKPLLEEFPCITFTVQYCSLNKLNHFFFFFRLENSSSARSLSTSHTTEPSVKSAAPADLSLTHTDQTTTAKSSSISPTRLTSSAQDEESGGSRNTTAPSAPGEESKRSESTTAAATQGTSGTVTPALEISVSLPVPTPTEYESPLTVVAFGVISFIVILVVVVIILVSVVSLRFKCNRSKDSEDKQKPGSSMVSEGCSAGTSEKDNSITLISMKNINMNNSKTYPPSEKVL
uniref:Endothelial cell surface expressed chemotaxis and apoptosis regulator n=1 Tax=Gallus gallus TaxID=9031 RepID=A0A8V0XZ60_CHICK